MLQVLVISITILLMIAAGVGIDRIREGLDITDIVPRGTNEHQFLETQSKYFGFYNFYAVTKVQFLPISTILSTPKSATQIFF